MRNRFQPILAFLSITLATTLPLLDAWALTAPDLGSPRKAVRAFLDAARENRWEAAAQVLDLTVVAPEERAERGPELARQFSFILDQTLWIDLDAISDDPHGNQEDGPTMELVGRIKLDGHSVPILLTRSARGNTVKWLFSVETVSAIPLLNTEYGMGWLGEWMPRVMFRVDVLGVAAWQWVGLIILVLLTLLITPLLHGCITWAVRRLARRTTITWDDELIEVAYSPVRMLLGLGIFYGMLGTLHLPVPARMRVEQVLSALCIAGLSWLSLKLLAFGAATVEKSLTEGVQDPARVRGLQTQVHVLYRVASVVLVMVGGALVLRQFEVMRQVGTSLLASAGVAGIVIGLAAQRSISMLLAGIQLSITQPIRIGDTVIVEGEWGTIESITLTYVVVKVWDQRRLVLPITRFLDQPFQNWTKETPDIMGTVMVYADYTVKVDAVRAEVRRLVQDNPNWDGRECGLLVTDASDRVVTLRALVSASDASKLWDLRCAVREGLIVFLQQLEGGRYLPRARVDMVSPVQLTPPATPTTQPPGPRMV